MATNEESEVHLPPSDPALPHLPMLLDGAATAALLDAHLPGCAAGRFGVVECVPCYTRYKPGTSALVQYRIRFRDTRDGRAWPTLGFIRLFSDEHGAKQWAKRALQVLVERAARAQGCETPGFAAYVPELRALVQIFPVDLDLRALARVAAPGELRHLLRNVPSADGGRPAEEPGEVVRYKPGRKALQRVGWESGATEAAYVKVLGDDRGTMLVQAAESLRRNGVATPRVIAHRVDRRVVVHEAVPGVSLASLRGSDTFAERMSAVGEALARLQLTAVSHLPAHPLTAEAAVVARAAEMLSTLLPDLTSRVSDLLSAILSALSSANEQQTTVHGDFYDDQIVVSDAGITLIDLDEVRLSHPLLDVGNMLAHLAVADQRGVRTAEARTAFVESYAQSRHSDARDLSVFEAAALLKLAVGPFRQLEIDWPFAAERILALAARRLRVG